MDISRPSVFPYENQENSYADIPKFGATQVIPSAHYRAYNTPKSYGSPGSFTKSSPVDDGTPTIPEGNFPFGHNDQVSEKFQFPPPGDEHYIRSISNGDFHPHDDHHSQATVVSSHYGRSSHVPLPNGIASRQYVPPQGADIYSNGVDVYNATVVNGVPDHYPHPRSPPPPHFYGPELKYIATSSEHIPVVQPFSDFNKFPPNVNVSHGLHSYRSYSSVSEYPPASFYPNHESPDSFSNSSGSTGAHQPITQSSIFAGNKFPFLPRNSRTPTLPLSRDSDVDQVDETHKCKNTIEGTKTSVRRFKKWYRDKYGKNIDLNTMSRFNAPELLKDFFLEIRDTRPGRVGNEYEPVTLTTYRNGLRRYFLYRKVPPAPDNFDLTDKSFDIVNRRLMSKRDDLKRKGKGNHPNAIESITPEQLDKMWAAGAIGVHAPRPLLRLQWWLNTVFHGVRGRMQHHDLNVDDFRLSRGPDGKLCVEYTKQVERINAMKLEGGTQPMKSRKRGKGIVTETDGGERDPVRAFEIYKAHRPPGISSFYLTPKQKPKGNIWFNKVPMGKNSIGRIMREIKAIAGIN